MKTTNLIKFFVAFFITLSLSSCTAIGDIFKTGVGVGVFIVIFIIVLIAGILIAVSRKS